MERSTEHSFTDTIAALREPTRELRRAAPESWAAFADLHKHAVRDGVVPSSIKELVALAIAVAEGCDGCVGYHARAAVAAGATREEAVEILEVALLMAGGPASVWAPRGLAAFDEFAAAQAARAER